MLLTGHPRFDLTTTLLLVFANERLEAVSAAWSACDCRW
jgi:hypothetical protein